jgi:signal transduction histidine kinase
LSIVRHIINAHGGEIHLRSSPGQGSRFSIQLPMASESTYAPSKL